MNAIAAACVVYYSLIATAPEATQQQTVIATQRSTVIGAAESMTDGLELHEGAVVEVFHALYQQPQLIMPFMEALTASRDCDRAYTDAATQLLRARAVR